MFDEGEPAEFLITAVDPTPPDASISPTSGEFDLYQYGTSHTTINADITWNRAHFIKFISDATGNLTLNDDYSITDNKTLKILPAYLDSVLHEEGDVVVLDIHFDIGAAAHLTITAIDTTPEDATIDPTEAEYVLAAGDNVTTEIAWGDDVTLITLIDDGSEDSLVLDSEYTCSGTTLTIFNSYLEPLLTDAGDNVTLTIQFNLGNPAVFTITAVDTPPVAVIGGPYSGNEGSPIGFDASGSYDNGTITSYEWDWDYDGSTFDSDATGVTAQHTWIDDGSFTIALRVTDDRDQFDIATAIVTVDNVAPGKPGIEITPAAPYTDDDLVCSVTANSADPGDDDITYIYEWYKNEDSELSHTGATLTADKTTEGDTWTCRVRAWDGDDHGDYAVASVTVLNSLPSAPAAPPPPAGGGSGSGGAGSTDDKRYTNLSGSSDSSGVTWEEVIAYSVDLELELIIPKGTQVLNANGYPPYNITVTTLSTPEDAPDGTSFIGFIFDVTPNGLTFDPYAVLKIRYDETSFPKGVSEENLVIYTWNSQTGAWEALECTVDTENNVITAVITHLCKFTIAAGTAPAQMALTDLAVMPQTVGPGDTVTVDFTIANTGDLTGTYEAVLTVDGIEKQRQTVQVAGGAVANASFVLTAGDAGTYTVTVGNRRASFTVAAPEPERVPEPAAISVTGIMVNPVAVTVGTPVTLGVTVTNSGGMAGDYTIVLKINGVTEESRQLTLAAGDTEVVTLTITKNVAGAYTAECDGRSITFTVKPTPTTTTASMEVVGEVAQIDDNPMQNDKSGPNWTLIGIIAAVIVLGGGFFAYRRYRSFNNNPAGKPGA